jgi:parallel beta-helix repeat protein
MLGTPRRNQTRALLLLVLFGLLGMMPHPPVATAAAPVTAISVTTTRDSVDGNTASLAALQNTPGLDGAISLREAMLAAEATTGHAQLTITFNLPGGIGYDGSTGTWEIYLDAAPTPLLPQLLRGNITIDATSLRNANGQPTVIINGFEIYEPADQSNGFVIRSANNILRGLALVNFYDSAVVLDGPQAVGNTIAGNSIGESLFGRPSFAGFSGVAISGGASGNMIGGSTDTDRNWIVGNVGTGVELRDTNTRDNTVAGNWVGIGIKGNVYSNAVGISIRDGAGENVIGSTVRGNLISGNAQGISLYNSNDNRVIGNLIGLGADGRTPVANQNGGIILFGGANGNQIGGSAAGERNTIAANGGQGIYISDQGSDNNRIQGNYIGVAADGSTPRGNLRQGILVAYNAHETEIGGSTPGQGNVIAYNGLGGIRLDSDQNTVAGNLIGVAADGTTPLGNQFNGIRVGGNENVIGPGNLIANNQMAGVVITGNHVTVQGNRLVANATAGMCVTGIHAQLIANEITANGANGPLSDECAIRSGVFITGTQTLVQSNIILDNQAPGVVVSQGSRNRLGANSISNNQISGIALRDGGNIAIAAPTITVASRTQVDGIGCANCTIEVFGDDGDQGRDLLGTTTANAQGQFQLTLASAPIRNHATATNTDANGNTSPFSQPVALPISLFLPLVVTP